MHYVFFLKSYIDSNDIIKLLGNLFCLKTQEIGELNEEGEKIILRFEIEILDNTSEFKFELNIYCHSLDLILNKGFYNNLILGVELSTILKKEILINDESDDPYQWILINEKWIYLVESEDNNHVGITLKESRTLPLSLSKAMELLPNEQYILDLKEEKVVPSTYYVKSSFLWQNLARTEGADN